MLSAPLSAQDEPQQIAAVDQEQQASKQVALKQSLSKIRALFGQNRWQEAEMLLENLARDYPDESQVHYWLGLVFLKLGKESEGIGQIEQSVVLAPNNIRLKIELAKAYKRVERLDAAGKLFEEAVALSRDEEFHESNLELGRLYAETGRVDEAVLALEQVVSLAPGSKYGKEAIRSLRPIYQSQAQDMVKALKATGADVSTALPLSVKLVNKNELDSAQQILEAYLARQPDDAKGYYWLGQVFMKQRDYAAGVAQIEKGVALAPQNMKLKIELGKAYERVGRHTDAWSVYAEIIAGAENEALVARAEKQMDLLQGQEYTEQGEHQKAAEIYRSLAEQYPQDLKPLNLLANSYQKLGKVDEVAKVVEKVLAIDAGNSRLRLWLAGLYEGNDQQDLAHQQYLEIIKKEPRSSKNTQQALRKLGLEEGLALARQNKFDLAQRKFQQVLDVLPDQPEANYYLGVMLQKQRKYAAAEKVLQKAIKINPDNLKTKLKLGGVYTEMGRLVEATDMYKQVMVQGRGTGEEQEARAKLSSLVKDMSEQGRSMLSDGDLDEAQKIYEALIAHESDDARWYFWLSQVYEKRQEYNKAVELLEKSSKLSPGNFRLLRSLGEAYINAGMLDKAEQTYLKFLEASPYNAESRFSLATIYDKQGKQRRADQQIARLIELDPLESLRQKALNLAGLEKGKELLDKGELEAALNEFERVLSIVPDDPQTHSYLGDLYVLQENHDAAEAAYLKVASAEHPLQAEILLKLADLYADTGRADEAVRVFNEIITRHKTSREATQAKKNLQPIFIKRADSLLEDFASSEEKEFQTGTNQLIGEGVIMLELNGFSGANKIFSEIVKNQPGNPRALYWLGETYFRLDSYNNAATLYKKSAELAPDNLAYKEALARAYYEDGKYRLAIDVLATLLEAMPGDTELHMLAAESYRRSGGLIRAEQHFARVLQLDPQGEQASLALDRLGYQRGLILARQEQLDLALDIFRRILVAIPDEPQVNFELGKIYLKQKRYTDAEKALQKVIQILPDHAGANLWLGRLYAETEDLDEAIARYERVVELTQGTLQAQEARHKLTGLYRHHADEMVVNLQNSPARIDAALPFARKLLARGELDGAQKILETLLVRRPDDAQGNYWLGQVYVKRKDNDAAKKFLRRSVSLAPDNFQLRFALGQFYDRIGSLEDAKRIYQEVIAGSEDKSLVRQVNKRLMLVWGRDYTEQGDHQAALAEHLALQKIYPQDSMVLGLVGWSYLRLGETRKADEIFEQMLQQASDDVEINMRMAEVYAGRGDAKRYKEQLIKVIQLDPAGRRGQEVLDILGYREGVELSQSEEPDRALQIFQRILSDVPDVPQVNYQAGLIYIQQGSLLEAEAAFKKVLHAKPDHLEAGMKLAQLYFDLAQENKAIVTLEHVVEKGRGTALGKEAVSKLSRLYQRRAERLSKAGESEFAIREYEALLKYDPDNAAAHYNLALLFTALKRMDEALEEFLIVTRLAPDNSGAYLNMARIHVQKGRFQQAAESYAYAVSLIEDEEKAVGTARKLGVVLARHLLTEDRPGAALKILEGFRNQNDPEINYYLGVVYRQQGDMESAVAAFRDAVGLATANVALRYNLAILYQRTNEDQLALNQYREILKSGRPGNVYVERARRNITAVENRLRRFTSTLRYDTSLGDTTVDDEVREIETSSFISTVNYNLATRFRPQKNVVLTLSTGFSYATNHSNESDSMRPRLGLRANINYPDKFFTANATYTESHGLLLDTFAGRGINLGMVGGLRLEDPIAYLKNLLSMGDKEGQQNQGESEIERSSEPDVDEEAREADTTGLRRALNDAYQELIPDKKERPIPVEEEEVKQYIVRKGDTLWDISAALLLDPFLWPEIWQTNPDIINPHLIFPKDVITLFYIGGVPVLRIEREGRLISLPPEMIALNPEEMARRAGRIRQNIDENLAAYENALNLMGQGRYQEALPLLENVHDVIPENPVINLNLGITYMHLSRFQEAEQALKQVLEVDSDNLQARLLLGELYARMGRTDDAIALLQEVIAMAAGTPQAAQAERQLREVLARRAMRMLDQTELTPADIAAIIDDGVRLMGMSDLEGARQVFHALLTRFPENGDGYYWLARINIRQGNEEIAIAFLEQSLVYLPDNMIYRYALAERYENQLRLTDAEQIYLQIIEEADDEQLLSQSRRQLALMRAARFSVAGDFATALSMYLEIQDRYPEDTELLERIGIMHEQLEQPDLALQYYEKAVALEPENIDIRLRLAALYERLTMRQKAREQLAAILDLEPDETRRKIILDRLGLQKGLELMRENRLDDALEMFENVLSVVPDEPLARLNIGIIYTLQGRYAEAEALFIELLESDPRNLSARFRLGMLYSETGRLNKAITVLEQVAREGADTDTGAQAAVKLKALEAERLKTLTLPQLKKAEPQPKTFQAGLTFNDFTPENVTLTETRSWGANLQASYPTIKWGNWAILYDYRSTDNEQPLGTDYAFASHQFRLAYNRPVPRVPRLFGSVTLGWQAQKYSYPDTNARFALGVDAQRENRVTSASLNLSYRAHDDLTLFAGYSYRDTRSNLPVGLVYSPNGVPVAFQGVSLGDFSSSFFNLGLQFRF